MSNNFTKEELVKLRNIMKKLEKCMLIRHINGNTLDNRRVNLERVSPKDTFFNKDWTVDVVLNLTNTEYKLWAKAREIGDISVFN